MATITIDGDAIALHLTRGEKVAALRGDVRVPLCAVADVAVEPDGLRATTGLRAPGLAVPGWRKIGTWRGRGRGRRAVVSTRRGMPAVRVSPSSERHPELLVGTPHAVAVATAIRRAAGLAPAAGDGTHEEQVTILAGDVTLTGTLRTPRGPGPHPAALLLPGSGPLDRDSNHSRMRLDVGRALAEALAERGIASLRYDRRGVGASTGSFLAAGLHDNAADGAAALDWLRRRPELDAGAALVVGHSEGALLATAIAGDGAHDDLAGVVLLAGAARTGEETLAWQTRQIVPTLHAPVRAILRLLRVDLVAKQRKNVERLRATTTDVARIGGRRVNARWHRDLIAFDPTTSLARIHVPVLAITGDKDLQVDPADLEAITRIVPGPVDAKRVPDLTHVLRRDPDRPTIGAYRKLVRRPVDPEVLELVAGWAAARTGVS